MLLGGIAGGMLNSTISNCGNNASINGSPNVGGICGYSEDSTIENCFNNNQITGLHFCGGIVGQSTENSIIQNCYNKQTISYEHHGGGIVGGCTNTQVTSCYNSGLSDCQGAEKIETMSWSHAGGICGNVLEGCTISKCFNTGAVKSSGGGMRTGGLCGEISTWDLNSSGYTGSSSNMISCYNTGNVTSNGYRIGGLVGCSNTNGYITDVYLGSTSLGLAQVKYNSTPASSNVGVSPSYLGILVGINSRVGPVSGCGTLDYANTPTVLSVISSGTSGIWSTSNSSTPTLLWEENIE